LFGSGKAVELEKKKKSSNIIVKKTAKNKEVGSKKSRGKISSNRMLKLGF